MQFNKGVVEQLCLSVSIYAWVIVNYLLDEKIKKYLDPITHFFSSTQKGQK